MAEIVIIGNGLDVFRGNQPLVVGVPQVIECVILPKQNAAIKLIAEAAVVERTAGYFLLIIAANLRFVNKHHQLSQVWYHICLLLFLESFLDISDRYAQCFLYLFHAIHHKHLHV